MVVALGLEGCGRIDFDPLSDAAGSASPPWPTLAGTWMWIDGPNVGQQRASYGTRGVASPTNEPGARDNGASWTARDGSMWLFGGYGLATTTGTGHLGDLWRFEPSSGTWTWMHGGSTLDTAGTYGALGVPDPANQPGGRNDPVGWVDAAGDLWLFGGNGVDATACTSELNDVWRFQIGTGEWTWMMGSSTCGQPGAYGAQGVPDAANVPGARGGAVIWTTSAGVWLFGGDGFDRAGTNGRLGDLWRYDQNAWTWIAGSDTVGQPPVHGMLGVSSPANYPGGRSSGCAWTRSDELWLFGGGATDGRRNDLWRYTISTGLWTWIAGSNAVEQPGVYGARGIPDPTTAPGARISSFCWQDARGDFWLFGGRGRDRAGTLGALSDLWAYMPATGEWTWVAGNDLANQLGHYGTLGVADAANSPGGRDIGGTWTRGDGSLWLFGGDIGFDSTASVNQLSDLWRFGPP